MSLFPPCKLPEETNETGLSSTSGMGQATDIRNVPTTDRHKALSLHTLAQGGTTAKTTQFHQGNNLKLAYTFT